jgi:hypothetical protein
MVYWVDFMASPPWFYGKDIIIDLVSAFVVLLIALFALRNYFFNTENKRQLVFFGAFGLLSLSFIIKSATALLSHAGLVFNYKIIFPWFNVGFLLSSSDLSAVGFLLYAGLTLMGLYVLYALTSEKGRFLTMNHAILAYFIVLLTYFSRFQYFLLYLTGFLFLFATVRRYFIAYNKNNYKNTLLLAISFSIIALSQIIFMFTLSNHLIYVFAELVQLVGYLTLMYTFFRVLRIAKKKKQN